MNTEYDVLVVGGGHAGIEAALAARRMGCRTLMVTARVVRIGEMSCNPAIGGIAKGTIVREVDALDGSMAKAADGTSLQFKMLNRRKGPAVWGPRVQSDAAMYARFQQRALFEEGVEVLEDEVVALLGMKESLEGVRCRKNGELKGKAIVLANGTFLGGRLFRGEEIWRGGRIGDISSDSLENELRRRMFHVERFKTGTPSRILKSSVNVECLEEEESEVTDFRFSFSETDVSSRREPCYTVYSNSNTAEIVKSYLHRSPLLGGSIEGTGPRYCPSFEDKVVKFPDRPSHRIYVEPMGSHSRYFYLNGLSSSLPREAQEKMVRSLKGFENAVIAQYGYAVEYSYFHHSQIGRTLKLKGTSNLFVAGQICGTSGYEEAAGLGVVAGANAARTARNDDGIELSRMKSYIGVMIDDIVGKGVDEPYRMFSSRAENRLYIRQDNADRRMIDEAVEFGLLGESKRLILERNRETAEEIRTIFNSKAIDGTKLGSWCRRTDSSIQKAMEIVPDLRQYSGSVLESVFLDEKYGGYIERNLRKHQTRIMSSDISLEPIDSYMEIEEICWEAREVLERERPATMAQAESIPGVRPTDLQGLLIHLGRKRSTWNNGDVPE